MVDSTNLQQTTIRSVQAAAKQLVQAMETLKSEKANARNRGIDISAFDETTAGTIGQVIDFNRAQELCDWAESQIVNNDSVYVNATAIEA